MQDPAEFCAGVLRLLRHDLRTPLAAMVSLAELLATDPAAPLLGRQARMLDMLRSSGEQLLEMLESVQEYADLSSSQETPGPVPLAVVLNEAVEGARTGAERRSIRLVLEAPPLQVEGRRGQLHLMLRQLLRNALQHAPADSVVRVAAEAAAGGVEVLVEDEGPGLPAETAARLGEPFQRGPGSHEPRAGLGLAIAHEVARLHGGSLAAETPESGRGTRIRVRLPG